MEKNNPEIFISFSTKDLDKCEKLISKLDSKHCNFWYQEKIGIGEEYLFSKCNPANAINRLGTLSNYVYLSGTGFSLRLRR